MFRVDNTILADDIATSRFHCDVSRCKGACCVVGDAGAPVSRDEIPALRKAWNLLKDELSPEAREAVNESGLVQGDQNSGYEISCVDGSECVFVQYDADGVANCAIQKAYQQNRIDWEKPVSCHLYPIRLKKISGMDFANFEYIPDLCSAGCNKGEQEGTWLSDFLETALTRRYGARWYVEFTKSCKSIRERVRDYA